MAKPILVKTEISALKKAHSKVLASILKNNVNPTLTRAMELAQEKGASSWLTVLLIQEHRFVSHKSAFKDADMTGHLLIYLHHVPEAHRFLFLAAFLSPKGILVKRV